MHTWADVAILARVKGNGGRFVVQGTAGLPFLLEEGDEVSFVPPQTDVPRCATVAYARQTGPCEGEVAFRGIEGAHVPRQMKGMHCLIRRNTIDDGVFQSEPRMWSGWIVEDEVHGILGDVAEIIDNPGQALMRVSRADGEGNVYVPVVDDIVVDVDVAAQRIKTLLPSGLLELEA